jgi:hypothetical protein
MKKLKTTFTALVLAGSLLLVSTGVAGAAALQNEDEPVMTYIITDPGTGGGGK